MNGRFFYSGLVCKDHQQQSQTNDDATMVSSHENGNSVLADSNIVRDLPHENSCCTENGVEQEKTAQSQVLANADLLASIMDFFVSRSGSVDGDALRTCDLVCRRWKDVARSSQLWSIPTSMDRDTESRQLLLDTSDISPSLSLRDVRGQQPTLAGFTLVQRLPTAEPSSDTSSEEGSADCSSSYIVEERSTTRRYRLTIANDITKSPQFLKELYHCHSERGNDFLSSTPLHDNTSVLGITYFNNKIARWYHAPCKESVGEQIHVSCPDKNLLLPFVGVSEESSLQLLDELLRLEQLSEQEQSGSNSMMYEDCWAPLVDWTLEIVECFETDDRIAFYAMSLLRRFVALCPYRVQKCRYQLVAGACIHIASKLYSKQGLDIQDIVFCADNSFPAERVSMTENMVLQHLNWSLAHPTIFDFVSCFTALLQQKDDTTAYWMMRYLSELALQLGPALPFSNSQLAASIVVLARFATRSADLWPDVLQHATEYAISDLSESTMVLCERMSQMRDTMPGLIIVDRRYRSPARGQLGLAFVRRMSSFATMVAFHEESRQRTISA